MVPSKVTDIAIRERPRKQGESPGRTIARPAYRPQLSQAVAWTRIRKVTCSGCVETKPRKSEGKLTRVFTVSGPRRVGSWPV